MNKVLIVDDETIVRVTLHSLVDWQKFGFSVEADFVNGRQALEYMKEHRIDLMFTDMKMPEMGGIELIENLNREGKMPVTIVLSGYDDFDLVRESFRLGAYDYLLKSDLTGENLEKILTVLNESIFKDYKENTEKLEVTASVTGAAEELRKELEPGKYSVVIFEIDDYRKQAARFLGAEEDLKKSMLELVRQIPRVAYKAKIQAVSPYRYIMCYRVMDPNLFHHNITSTVRQIQSVWRDYMNLTVSAAITEEVERDKLDDAVLEAYELFKLVPLKGKGALCADWDTKKQLELLNQLVKPYKIFVSSLYSADILVLNEEKKRFFAQLREMDKERAQMEAISVIALLSLKFHECGDDFYSLFPEEIDYYEKIMRLQNTRELELWLGNYFGWVLDYIGNKQDNKQTNIILRARRFMMDNCANPELTLKSVADYVGLNEKYFTTRFTKETGSTFINYLTDLRIQKAKELMNTTELRIYEISEHVGYRNVEHFNRTFKKTVGVSPRDYKSRPQSKN
ncbi:MAG: response regulator [Clostridium sp.]